MPSCRMSIRLIPILLAVALAACSPAETCNAGCTGSDGSCMTCSSPHSCNSGGSFSAAVNGVACCSGGGGGGGGGGISCNPGYCVSNGACCPSSSRYYCRGSCYSTYNDLLHAGCTGVVSGACF